MLMNLTSLLAACTMISCVTLVSAEDPKKGSGSGEHRPLSQAGGSNGSTNDRGDSDGSGSWDHGLDGERWQDTVPRLPMWYIATSGGIYNSSVHPEDNFRGYVNWWRGDQAVEELVIRIERGYDVGARWFFVNRPMGAPANTHVPGASWLTMSADKREELPKLLTDALLSRFDEPVHVVWFVGSDMSDARAFPGWSPAEDDKFFGVGEGENWNQLVSSRVTLGGWISTGASGIAFDHSAPLDERDHFIRLFEQLNGFPFHLAIYGEAYPLKHENGRVVRGESQTPLLDQEAISSMPWIAIDRFLEGRWPLYSESESFPLDPDETRMFVWFNHAPLHYGNDGQRARLVNSYMDWNLIPITNDPVMFQEALDRLSPAYARADDGSGGSDGQANQQSGRASGRESGHGTEAQVSVKSRAKSSGVSTTRRVIRVSSSASESTDEQDAKAKVKANLPQRYTRNGRRSKADD